MKGTGIAWEKWGQWARIGMGGWDGLRHPGWTGDNMGQGEQGTRCPLWAEAVRGSPPLALAPQPLSHCTAHLSLAGSPPWH